MIYFFDNRKDDRMTPAAGLVANSPWLTLNDAASYLSKPPSWMYDNAQRLGIPHTRLGREYRFRIDLLDEWLTQQISR